MKIFHCPACDQLVFFENTHCMACGSMLAFDPETLQMIAIPATGDASRRMCANAAQHQNCNWTVRANDPNPLCRSCRLTRVIPDLSVIGAKEAWTKLEIAKKRLVYNLLALGLPVIDKGTDPVHGLAFEFLADQPTAATGPILTGHAEGVITINIAEADDPEREKRRIALHEPYRTLLGHFRHEVGHYYWDRLIQNSPRLGAFRETFGDETADYAEALKKHYEMGPVANWQEGFISAYAASHPWEDWAETWAHYMHMTDTLETAAGCGLSLRPSRRDEPSLPKVPSPTQANDFSRLADAWFPLTYVLNNLNRGLGLPDGYPFVLSTPAIEKLRFIHDTITAGVSPTAEAKTVAETNAVAALAAAANAAAASPDAIRETRANAPIEGRVSS